MASGVWSVADAYHLLRSVGATPDEAEKIAAKMPAESGGDPTARNPAPCGKGLNAVGLFQICNYPNRRPDQLTDPKVNAEEALKVIRGQGIGAWTGASTGALEARQERTRDQDDPGYHPSMLQRLGDLAGGLIPGPMGDIAEGAFDTADFMKRLAESLVNAAKWLADPGNWWRIAEGILGAVLIFMGFSQISSRSEVARRATRAATAFATRGVSEAA